MKQPKLRRFYVILMGVLFFALLVTNQLFAGDYFEDLGIAKPLKEIHAIDFPITSLKGVKVNLKDFHGKVIFLNFWATWCGPCKSEVKEIDALYKKLKNEDFTVFAVDIKEDKKRITSFMKANGIDFPVYIDSDGMISAQYGVRGIPTTYLIAPDGRIVGRAIGPRPWASEESIKLMRSLMKK